MTHPKKLFWSSQRRVEQEQEEEETEGIQKKRRLQPPPSLSIFDVDLKLPVMKNEVYGRCRKLLTWLPYMARMFWSQDWSSLLKFTASSGSNVDIKYALQFDLVALCVWFLYTEVPSHVKEVVAWALASIHNATSEAKFDDNTDTHQMSVDYLVKTVLHSENKEVLRQACCALTLLASCRRKGDDFAKDVTFGGGVQNWLLELVKHGSPYALLAVSKIARDDKGMRGIIISAELKESFLPGLLKRKDVTILEYALWTIACITRVNNDRWDDMEGGLIPCIVEVLQACDDWDVCVAAACVIDNALDGATPEQIEKLVDMGCLEALCIHLDVEDSRFFNYSLETIKYVLAVWDKENNNENKYENKYAKRITAKVGWSAFRKVKSDDGFWYFAYEARKLLVEYVGVDEDYGPKS